MESNFPPFSSRRGTAAGSARLRSEMASTLMFALGTRETTLHILQHSTRVAALACAIAERVSATEREVEELGTAAGMHEIGMLSVPPDLLLRRSRLSPDELERVRGHAAVGAEIVRPLHGDRAARLVERQYEDYDALRRRTRDSRELLLAGILRLADVFDAMKEPRPYQAPVPDAGWRYIVHAGSGSKFHPAAVYALFHLLRDPVSDPSDTPS